MRADLIHLRECAADVAKWKAGGGVYRIVGMQHAMESYYTMMHSGVEAQRIENFIDRLFTMMAHRRVMDNEGRVYHLLSVVPGCEQVINVLPLKMEDLVKQENGLKNVPVDFMVNNWWE